MGYTVYADYPDVLGSEANEADIDHFNALVSEEWPDGDWQCDYKVTEDAGSYTLGKPPYPELQEAIARAWDRFCAGE